MKEELVPVCIWCGKQLEEGYPNALCMECAETKWGTADEVPIIPAFNEDKDTR